MYFNKNNDTTNINDIVEEALKRVYGNKEIKLKGKGE